MIVNRKSIYTLRLISDLILLNLAFFLAATISQSLDILMERTIMFVLLLLSNIVWFFNASMTGLYSDFFTRPFAYQFTNILKSSLVQALLAVTFIFLVKEALFTRNFIVLFTFLIILFISIRTIVFRKTLKTLRKKGKNVRNLLIIGSGEVAENFRDMINNNPDLGYKFYGVLDGVSAGTNKNIVASFNNLNSVLEKKEVDEVVIALPEGSETRLDELIRICNINAVKVHIIPDYFRFLGNRFQASTMGNFPIITAREEPLNEANRRFIKRMFDFLFSFFVLIFILSWLFPIVAILIKISSPGPVLFIQERFGVKNKKFKCFKFRTLKVSADSSDKFKPLTEDDSRITRIGGFLRRTNIDELLQFVNVLKGEMSVVGPRPHAITFDAEYEKIFEEIKMRYNVKPGITGWAQIHGFRGDVPDIEENKKRLRKRMEYDLWYIENWSFKLDIQIILMTVWQMISGESRGV
jgi:putative colanic acid biosysnthesis UDP-glucose lipid carrier transferase